jgi:hypothetical protein
VYANYVWGIKVEPTTGIIKTIYDQYSCFSSVAECGIEFAFEYCCDKEKEKNLTTLYLILSLVGVPNPKFNERSETSVLS